MIQRGEENVFGRNIIEYRVTILYTVQKNTNFRDIT